MKKIFKLTVVLFCLTTLVACSSDDGPGTPKVNTQQLIKRWFYFKTKIGNQTQNYENLPCGKDFLEFQANNAVKKSNYTDCQQDPTVTNGTYTLVEDTKKLTTIIGSETINYTITKLNSKEFEAETTLNNVKITYIFTSTP